MTRLITDWIADIEETIRDRDRDLKNKTGMDYAALAAKVGGFSASDIERASRQLKVAVVPVTTGQGIIGSFSESVAAVTRMVGFQSFVTDKTDVNGLHEAYQDGADIIFMADDDRFISVNLNKKKITDNDYATAAGYTAALEGAMGSLVGKEILILGCGNVGREFIRILKKRGATFAVYDINGIKLAMARKEDAACIKAPEEIKRYKYIIDATNLGGWLHRGMLHPEAWLAAPGVPLSLNQDAYDAFADRLIHDPLQIGVASMLGLTL